MYVSARVNPQEVLATNPSVITDLPSRKQFDFLWLWSRKKTGREFCSFFADVIKCRETLRQNAFDK